MSDSGPISWMMLDKGTRVVSAEGEEVGKVTEVVADRQKDIFSGIAISSGLFDGDRFAPADLIARITSDEVVLTVGKEQAESFETYEA